MRADLEFGRRRRLDHLVASHDQVRDLLLDRCDIVEAPRGHRITEQRRQRPRRRTYLKCSVCLQRLGAVIEFGPLVIVGREPHGIAGRLDAAEHFVDVGEATPVDDVGDECVAGPSVGGHPTLERGQYRGGDVSVAHRRQGGHGDDPPAKAWRHRHALGSRNPVGQSSGVIGAKGGIGERQRIEPGDRDRPQRNRRRGVEWQDEGPLFGPTEVGAARVALTELDRLGTIDRHPARQFLHQEAEVVPQPVARAVRRCDRHVDRPVDRPANVLIRRFDDDWQGDVLLLDRTMSAELESGVGSREVIAIRDNDVVVAGNLNDEFGLGSPADGIRRDRHHSFADPVERIGIARQTRRPPTHHHVDRARVGRQRFRKGHEPLSKPGADRHAHGRGGHAADGRRHIERRGREDLEEAGERLITRRIRQAVGVLNGERRRCRINRHGRDRLGSDKPRSARLRLLCAHRG